MAGAPDLSVLGSILADRRDGTDHHVILSDPDGEHHFWLHGEDASLRPAVILPLDDVFELRIEVLWRLYRRLRGQTAGKPPPALDLTPMRRARLIQLLHILDYRLTGAKPRAIAAALIDADASLMSAAEWKSSAARRKARRWIKDAETLMNGGYRRLLRGQWLPGEDN